MNKSYLPTNIYYLISLECNQKCSKCSHWKHEPERFLLGANTFVNNILKIPSATELCIVGGEPLLYSENILHILKGLLNTGIRTTIITNGVLMDQSFIDQIKDFNIHLVVSIDTIDREFWKFVRGSDSFDLVFRNLDYAIRTLQPSQLSIQSVLAEETKGHVIQVGEFANSHNIYHSIQNYIQEGFEGHWTPIVTPTENNSPEDESSCYAAGRNISIMPNGDVYTCFQQSWIQGCEKPIGNLNANALDGMLSSQYTADVLSRMELCNKSCKVLKCNQK